MKRVLIAALCVLALLLAGCTAVNQTNSFVDQPNSGTIQELETTVTPEETQPPRATFYEQPTPAPSPETTPGDSNGFNG